MRDTETDTSSYRQHWAGAIDRRMTAVFLWTTIATALDSDLAFMTGAPLIVTLVEWAYGSLGNIDVLKVSEDA